MVNTTFSPDTATRVAPVEGRKSLSRMKGLDVLRGWCMIAILFFHCQMYYFGGDVIPYTLYVTNALALFYFLAGFFAWREQRPVGESLLRILVRLVIPYLIFTVLLGIVKQLLLTETFSVMALVSSVVSGRASWFVAALILIELVFVFLRSLTKDNSWAILLAGVAGVVGSYFLQRSPSVVSNFHNGIPFAVPPALLGLFYYAMGFLFHRHVLPTVPRRTSVGFRLRNGDDNVLRANKAMTITLCWLIPTLFLLVVVKMFENQKEYGFLFASLWANPFPLFVVDLLLSCFGLTTLLALLWPNSSHTKRHLSVKSKHSGMYIFMSPAWIGLHCMVFYFFAGAAPMFSAWVTNKVGLTFDLNSTWYGDAGFWLCFVLTIVITSVIAWVIYRWLPFLIGRKVSRFDK